MTRKITQCRSCGSGRLEMRVKLQAIYPSLFTDHPEPPSDWPKVPLTIVECCDCGLVQLEDTFACDAMYRNYWYKSSLNATMVSALRDVAVKGSEAARLKDGDSVLDVGCNDGTLLGCFRELNPSLRCIGVDPSLNLADQARQRCDVFINDYLGNNPGEKPVKLITAIAMFYDLDEVSPFLRSILSWLDEDGVLVIQMTDLLSMMRVNAFDNIVHEHLEYWSLSSLRNVCDRNGLTIFRVENNDVNGGSLRAYCCRRGHRSEEPSVAEYVNREKPWILDGWRAFEINLHRTLAALKSFLVTSIHAGKLVCGLGASTKGNTLLQLLETGPDEIECIGEVSADKIGKYTVGSGIPIVSEKSALDINSHYVLILPWHFSTTFKHKIGFRNLVFPMPTPRINECELW